MSQQEGPKPAGRRCERCGAVYTPRSANQRYCTPVCRDGARVARPCRHCDSCGIEFEPRTATQRFCGIACRTTHMASLKPILPPTTCAFCGQQFTPRLASQRFCQEPCRVAAQKAQPPASLDRRACAVCGAKFRPRNKTQAFCSARCKKFADVSRAREKIRRIGSGVEQTRRCCPVCRNRFTPSGPEQQCCSTRCAEVHLTLQTRIASESSLDTALLFTSPGDTEVDDVARMCSACGLQQIGSDFPKGHDVCFSCIEHERDRRAWLASCLSCARPIRGQQKCIDCGHLASVARQGAVDRACRYGLLIACDLVKPHRVWARDNYVCHICGLPTLEAGIPALQPVLEHVRPVVNGGPHTIDNLRCAHAYCNLVKSDSMKNPNTRRHVIALIAEVHNGPVLGGDEDRDA
jgi:hypothetical protein